jgi:hypothetical protein
VRKGKEKSQTTLPKKGLRRKWKIGVRNVNFKVLQIDLVSENL